jgi:hypothetical protein
LACRSWLSFQEITKSRDWGSGKTLRGAGRHNSIPRFRAAAAFRRQPQEFSRLDLQHIHEFADDLEACSVVDEMSTYDGAVYDMSDTPLGSTYIHQSTGGAGSGGIGGRIADPLINGGTFNRVIPVPVAVGSTAVVQWIPTVSIVGASIWR